MKKMLHNFFTIYFPNCLCGNIFTLCHIWIFYEMAVIWELLYIYETAVPFIQPLLYGRSVFTGVDKGL